MLETFRPALRDGAQSRPRRDGSIGVHHGPTDAAAELAADQATLLALVDGRRSLSEIAEAHLHAHGEVPFAALRDLLRTLARRGLLANPRPELDQAQLLERAPWMQRWSEVVLGSIPLGAAGWSVPVIAVGLIALALWQRSLPAEPLSAWDVLLAYPGAMIALSARAFLRSGALATFRQPPGHLRLASTLGVLHLAPGSGRLVLLDNAQRVACHLAALAGAAVGVGIGHQHPGLEAGALAVLIADACPFAPTSVGKLLATLAGRVDLREHARAYLSKRLLRRFGSSHFFEGELSLITSTLLSLGWLSLVVRLLLTRGTLGVVQLTAVAEQLSGPERFLAAAGAVLLFACIPAGLVALLAAVVRAARSLLPEKPVAAGEHTAQALKAEDLSQVPIFGRLSAEELAALAEATRDLRFAPAATIVKQGDPGDAFFVVREGEVAVELEHDSGLTREVARLGPGDCFGETALLESRPRTATVRAQGPARVAQLSREAFDRVRESFPGTELTSLLRATAGLHRSKLFRQLSAERLSALALRLEPLVVPAGTQVVREGEAGAEFFLVGSGAVEVTREGAQVGRLGPGEHFGEIALLRNVPRTATVRALEDSLLLVLPKEAFIAGISSDLMLSTRLEELAAERAEAAR